MEVPGQAGRHRGGAILQWLIKQSMLIGVHLRSFAVPKARELFDTLGFKVCDVSTSVSKTGSDDFWLSYVLEKTPVK